MADAQEHAVGVPQDSPGMPRQASASAYGDFPTFKARSHDFRVSYAADSDAGRAAAFVSASAVADRPILPPRFVGRPGFRGSGT